MSINILITNWKQIATTRKKPLKKWRSITKLYPSLKRTLGQICVLKYTRNHKRWGCCMSKTFLFFLKCSLHQRLGKCPTIPTSETITAAIIQQKKSGKFIPNHKRDTEKKWCIPVIRPSREQMFGHSARKCKHFKFSENCSANLKQGIRCWDSERFMFMSLDVISFQWIKMKFVTFFFFAIFLVSNEHPRTFWLRETETYLNAKIGTFWQRNVSHWNFTSRKAFCLLFFCILSNFFVEQIYSYHLEGSTFLMDISVWCKLFKSLSVYLPSGVTNSINTWQRNENTSKILHSTVFAETFGENAFAFTGIDPISEQPVNITWKVYAEAVQLNHQCCRCEEPMWMHPWSRLLSVGIHKSNILSIEISSAQINAKVLKENPSPR